MQEAHYGIVFVTFLLNRLLYALGNIEGHLKGVMVTKPMR